MWKRVAAEDTDELTLVCDIVKNSLSTWKLDIWMDGWIAGFSSFYPLVVICSNFIVSVEQDDFLGIGRVVVSLMPQVLASFPELPVIGQRAWYNS